jgi:FtsZ-interacting cell division protein ZipA
MGGTSETASGSGSSTTSSPAAENDNQSHRVPTGAIAGGVIGALVVLALLFCGLWFWRRRHSRTQALKPDLDAFAGEITPYPPPTNSDEPVQSVHDTTSVGDQASTNGGSVDRVTSGKGRNQFVGGTSASAASSSTPSMRQMTRHGGAASVTGSDRHVPSTLFTPDTHPSPQNHHDLRHSVAPEEVEEEIIEVPPDYTAY